MILKVEKCFGSERADYEDYIVYVDAQDNHGATALHWAAMNGDQEVVEVLLRAQATVTIHDNSGWTALHAATWYGWLPIVERLLATKADVNAKDKDRCIALHMAAWKGYETIA